MRGDSERLGKSVGDDFREGKITLPVILCLPSRHGRRACILEAGACRGQVRDGDLEHALSLMKKYKAIEATLERARHYGGMAHDALAIFKDSVPKSALLDAVAFCVARAH